MPPLENHLYEVIRISLRFILGPAGSGKTSYIATAIADCLAKQRAGSGTADGPDALGTSTGLCHHEPISGSDGSKASHNSASYDTASGDPAQCDLFGRSILFIVPDQATFQMERLILGDPRLKGFMNLQVLSFRRLAWRVLEETGGTFHPFITPVGKNMAVQAILWDNRKDLTVFAPLVNYPGFRDNVTDILDELHTYEVTPDELKARAGDVDASFLERKIHDLGVVYSNYADFLKGRFLDPTDYLSLASERMASSQLVKSATVWVDGFSGFNPDEYRALGALLETACEVNVALCIDRQAADSPVSEDSLFHPTREALEKIREIAWKKGVSEVPAVYLGTDGGGSLPRFVSSDLSAIEAGLRGVGTGAGTSVGGRSSDQSGSLQVVDGRESRSFEQNSARQSKSLQQDGAGQSRSFQQSAEQAGSSQEGGAGQSGSPCQDGVGGQGGAEPSAQGCMDGQSEAEASAEGCIQGQSAQSAHDDGVQVIAAANPLAEVEFVAREIIRLVRDCGYRYRDITVETRELDKYAETVSLVFKDHGIPHFIDEKRSVSHHPLAELLRAAMDVALTSFSSEAVFRYLKTDLVPVSRASVDVLENYVLAHGINHQKWISEESWQFAKRYLVEEDRDYREAQRSGFCDEVRRKAVEHLAVFYDSVKGRGRRCDRAVAAELALDNEDLEAITDAEGRRHDDGETFSAVEASTPFAAEVPILSAADASTLPAVEAPTLSAADASTISAADVSLALYQLLIDLDVPGTLEKWQKEAEEAGDLAEAMVHAGLWDRTMEILEQASEILKDRPCDLKTYALLLDSGLHDIRLGVIPPSLDQVLVGNLDRSRQPACKATFLLGALAGSFPKRQSEDGIFTDGEREHLRSLGVEMKPGSRLRQLHEKYLVYIALTRPSHRLYVSYPLGDAEGKALEPSHILGTIRKMLGDRPERLVSLDPPGRMPDDLDYVLPARVKSLTVRRLALAKQDASPGTAWTEALRYMTTPKRDVRTAGAEGGMRATRLDGAGDAERCAQAMRLVHVDAAGCEQSVERPLDAPQTADSDAEGVPSWGSAAATALHKSAKMIDDADRILRSLDYRNFVPPLRRSTIKGLYGANLKTSVSRLERFSACPFSHFAADGLRLKERDIYKLEPADAGTFLHNALKDFVLEVSSGSRAWAELDEGEVRAAASKVVERLVPEVQEEIFLSSARYRHVGRTLGRVTQRAADVLTKHTKRGKFVPVALEAQFGLKGSIPPLTFSLGDLGEVALRGQIDRLDACVIDDTAYLRVIDYKSSPRALDLTDVYQGLSLQLLVYLLVAMSSWKDIIPAYGLAGVGPMAEAGPIVGATSAIPLTSATIDGSTTPAAVAGSRAPTTAIASAVDAESSSVSTVSKVIPAGALYFAVRDPIVSASGPVPEGQSEENLLKKLRMSGLVAGDRQIAGLMDTEMKGHSPIIPVQFTKAGLGSRSSVVPEDRFPLLLDFVKEKVRELASQVLKGRADILPYRKGQKRACTYCPFGPLCQFDALIQGNYYRNIKPVPPDVIWDELGAPRAEGGTGE